MKSGNRGQIAGLALTVGGHLLYMVFSAIMLLLLPTHAIGWTQHSAKRYKHGEIVFEEHAC